MVNKTKAFGVTFQSPKRRNVAGKRALCSAKEK
jgi:hypothetical protein